MVQNYVGNKILFVREMLAKAESQLLLRKKLRLKRQKLLEESKDQEKNESEGEEEDKEEAYPEECKVLDIMKEKYYDAVQFFRDTEDQKQLKLAVQEYQRFSYLYEKMSRYLVFDPLDIEDDIYQRLSPEDKDKLADPRIVREVNAIRRRKAAQILEDEDVNILNFQLF